MLELHNISKSYAENKNYKLSVSNLKIDDCSLNFLLGNSGCGKTTLLNIVATLASADSGELIFNNTNLVKLSENQKSNFRNNNVGFVFQDFKLIEDLNVFENVSLPLRLLGIDKIEDKVNESLTKVKMNGYGHKKICELSGGQKQRVAIARAIVKNPTLLLCDEPTGALDSKTSIEIFELLKEISKECIVIISSHDEDAALKYSDHTIKISNGNIVSNVEIKKNKKSTKSSELVIKGSKPKLGTFYKKFFLKNIFRKPIKLICATLITTFGLSSLLFSINLIAKSQNEVFANALAKSNTKSLFLKKEISCLDENEIVTFEDQFYEQDKEIILSKVKSTRCDFGFEIFETIDNSNYVDNYFKNGKKRNSCFDSKINYTFEIDEKFCNAYQINLITGKLPEKNNEIAITNYQYTIFEKFGYNYENTKIDCPSKEEIVGKPVVLNFKNNIKKEFYISGIIESKLETDLSNEPLYVDFDDEINELIKREINYSFATSLFVNKISDLNMHSIDKYCSLVSVAISNEPSDIKRMLDDFSSVEFRYYGENLDNYISSKCEITNDVIQKINFANNNIYLLEKIISFTSISLIILSFVFEYLFFSEIITFKMKDIGILKSLGFNNKDIAWPFAIIDIILSAFFLLVSIALCFLEIFAYNLYVTSMIQINCSFVSFDYKFCFLSVILLLLGMVAGLAIPLLKNLNKESSKIIKEIR